MDTHLEVNELDFGTFKVKAVQGQVVTLHTIRANPEFCDQVGLGSVGGADIVREVVEILLEHEALAAIPADSFLEQLVAHYPYLTSELQHRLSAQSDTVPSAQSPRIDPLPAEDRPTHT